MTPSEWWGTCPACWSATVHPVTETDHGDARLLCDCGHTFWVVMHNPMEEP